MPLPFPWEYVIPIKTWDKIKFTIKVDTKVTTKTAIIENSSSDTVYFLHVNHYTNEVYIKQLTKWALGKQTDYNCTDQSCKAYNRFNNCQ